MEVKIMAKSVKGTKTEKHLLESFAGESQARMRYTYFASKAKKEGFEQIAAIFTETADNEKEHAERFFKFLEGGQLEISGIFPAGIISNTNENLRLAAAGENEEHTKLYPEAAKVADEEGFPEIAECFRRISIAEKHHESRYLELLDNFENDRVFKKDMPIKWKCRNCGYV
jgi:rubrerythrin